jgi:sulfonate transport system permease protein
MTAEMRERLVQWSISLLVTLGAWQMAASSLLANWRVVPPPSQIIKELWTSWPTLLIHLQATSQAALAGFLLGAGIAVLLALVAVLFPAIEMAIANAALTVYCMPLLIIAPILQVLFSGLVPAIILAAVFVFFTVFIAALVGLRQIPPESLAVVHVYGGSRLDQLLRIRAIACLPTLMGGLAVAVPAAVVGAMVGEYMGSDNGLGIAMVYAETGFQVERTWGLALIAAGLALSGYLLVRLIGWQTTPWARDQQTPILVPIATQQPATGRTPVKDTIKLACIIGFGLFVWTIAFKGLALDPYFAKTPGDVWLYLWSDPKSAHGMIFLEPGLLTMAHASSGLFLGMGAAILISAVIRIYPSLEYFITPYLVVLSSVPVMAMIPVMTLILGRSWFSDSVIVGLLTFFPALVNLLVGLRASPEQASSLVRVAGGSRWKAVWTVQMPFALPWFFAALRLAAPGAIGGALLAEWLVTGDGMAFVMQTSRNTGEFIVVWTAGVIALVLSMIMYGVVRVLEKIVLRRFGFLS